MSEIETLQAEIDRLKDRLQIGPYGDDKIDELEAATEHLRAECDDLALRCAVLDEALKNAAAIVRLQNGNLHADVNAILAQADKALLETPRTAANDEVRAC